MDFLDLIWEPIANNLEFVIIGIYIVWREWQHTKIADAKANTEIRLESAETKNETLELANEREKLQIERESAFNRIILESQKKLTELEGENKVLNEQVHSNELIITDRRRSEDNLVLQVNDLKEFLTRREETLTVERDMFKQYVSRSEEMLNEFKDRERRNLAVIEDQEQQIARLKKLEDRFTSLEKDIKQEKRLRLEMQDERDKALVRAQEAEQDRDQLHAMYNELKSDFVTIRDELNQLKQSMNGHADPTENPQPEPEKEPEPDGTTTE